MAEISVSIQQAAISVAIQQAAISVTMTGGGSNNFVAENTKFAFNGQDGDSYIIYNSSLNRLELYKGGVLKAAW